MTGRTGREMFETARDWPRDDKGNLICGARARNNDMQPCRKKAGWGTDHVGWGNCKLHGGSSPAGKLFAIKLEANAFGITSPVDVDPLNALLDLVKAQAGTVLWLANKVASLEEHELTQLDENAKESAAVWMRMLGEWQDRLAKTSKLALDAGVEERLVRIAEEQGEWLVRTLDRVFRDLVLTPDQQERLPIIMGQVVQELGAGSEA